MQFSINLHPLSDVTRRKVKYVIMKDVATSAKGSEKKGLQTPTSGENQKFGSKTLFVGNLSFDVGEDDVVEFFKEAGEVVDLRLAKDVEGRFEGFGHVEFASEDVAQKAYEMNDQEVLGHGVRLGFARERGASTPYSRSWLVDLRQPMFVAEELGDRYF